MHPRLHIANSAACKPQLRKVSYEQTGPADQVLVVGDVPDPQPATGEVRVRLQWSGLNPSDVKARSGARGPVMPFPRVIPHSDGTGVIDAVDDGVDPSRIGERRLGPAIRHCGGVGVFAGAASRFLA